ncbi:MAG: hypothetical protein ABIQ44_02510, partial [Chloroflexia bacterium]
VGGVTPTAGRPTSTVEAVNTRPPKAPPTATLEEFFPQDPTEVVSEPTATPRKKATPTPVEAPTEIIDVPTEIIDVPTEIIDVPTSVIEDRTPVAYTGDYTLYEGPEGGWSVEYPSEWKVTEDPPNYQFLDNAGTGFIQVTYSAGISGMTHEELATLASDQFSKSFDNYEEQGLKEQSDGSYRLDFLFTIDGQKWDAQAFVEGRNDNLYMLMLAFTEEEYLAGKYDDIINHVIKTYTVPK